MNRLYLKPVNREHALAMHPILADPALYRFTGGTPPRDAGWVERWFSGLESRKSPDSTQDWLTWIVFLNRQKIPIGYVQATVTGEEADIAWLIGTAWQGQGYAKEAVGLMVAKLAERRVQRLTAHIHPDHCASQRVAAAVGLERTGVSHDGEDVWASLASSASMHIP